MAQLLSKQASGGAVDDTYTDTVGNIWRIAYVFADTNYAWVLHESAAVANSPTVTELCGSWAAAHAQYQLA